MLVHLRDGSVQFDVLLHSDRSCRSKFLSHPVTVYCTGPTSPSADPIMVATGVPIYKSLV